MDKEEYTTESKVQDISTDYDLQEDDDSPIEEVRVTISSTSPTSGSLHDSGQAQRSLRS